MQIKFTVYRYRKDSILYSGNSTSRYKFSFSDGNSSQSGFSSAYTDEEMILSMISTIRQSKSDEVDIRTIYRFDINYLGCVPYEAGDMKAIRDLVAENVDATITISPA